MFGSIETIQSYYNKSTWICYNACKSCYAGKKILPYQGQLDFLANRIKVGHESVIEHSNFFVAMIISYKHLEDLVDVLACCSYLKVHTKGIYVSTLDTMNIHMVHRKKIEKKNNAILVNIAGSIRGWKHIYKTLPNLSNHVLRMITKEIYKSLPKEYFIDMIKDGIFDESKFCPVNEDVKEEIPIRYTPEYRNLDIDPKKKVTIENYDKMDYLRQYIDKDLIINEHNEMADMLTVTVRFNGMARYSTQQTVRHRNAVTQESMRYVDYSNNKVHNPLADSEDYDPTKKYTINMPHIGEFILTADELCEALGGVYPSLKSQGVQPQDARGFGPFSTETGDLFMTFTIRNLCKFLQLRMDHHAQADIRNYAKLVFAYVRNIPELRDWLVDESPNEEYQPATLKENLLLPLYKFISENPTEEEQSNLEENIGKPVLEEVMIDGNKVNLNDVQIGKSNSKNV